MPGVDWALTLAVPLGTAIGCAITAIKSQMRWDLSLSVAVPPKGDDAGTEREGAGKVKNPWTWRTLVMGAIGIAGLCAVVIWAVATLPGYYLTAGLVVVDSLVLVPLLGVPLLDLAPFGQAVLQRTHDGLLQKQRIFHSSRHLRLTYTICGLAAGLVAPLWVFEPLGAQLTPFLLALLCCAMPLPCAHFFTDASKRSPSLRTLIRALCAVCVPGLTILGLAFYALSFVDSNKHAKEPAPSTVNPRALNFMQLCQPIILLWTVFMLVAHLYRVDVAIARKWAAEERTGLLEGANTELRIRLGDGTGEVCKEPSLVAYIRRQGKQLARPLYALIGTSCATSLLVAVPLMLPQSLSMSQPVSHSTEDPFPHADSPGAQMDPADDLPWLALQILVAVGLAPVAIGATVGLVSYTRGEVNMVWKWEADWSPGAGVEAEVAPSRDKAELDA